ncbi:hypothetical protein LEP1GSC037_2199 [Leptospira interrogans str. 2006001854]|uniref:Uncharacterized protein n=1 Tax=Leptospira interrogans str. 2006001854 TaxID=1001590 RepID=M6GD17_LEPIR|nr:hypothetical protein LEP1GSC037_2199 [Leptospira interrogans str. 2006001854]
MGFLNTIFRNYQNISDFFAIGSFLFLNFKQTLFLINTVSFKYVGINLYYNYRLFFKHCMVISWI